MGASVKNVKASNIKWLLAIALFCAACGTNETAIQTAISETELANPTVTQTLTAIPTTTSTIVPSPTSDLRVINTDPYDLLLVKDDLPKDAKYFLPGSDWISPLRNSEIVSGWGVEEGRDYLSKTGRIDGWTSQYQRGTSTVLAPEYVYDNVVLYSSAKGAMLVINEYSNCNDPQSDYHSVPSTFEIGDQTNVCEWRKMQSGGENYVYYRIEFVYRNVYHAIEIIGWEYEIQPEYAEMLATTALEKLQQIPLSDEVTFSP